MKKGHYIILCIITLICAWLIGRVAVYDYSQDAGRALKYSLVHSKYSRIPMDCHHVVEANKMIQWTNKYLGYNNVPVDFDRERNTY